MTYWSFYCAAAPTDSSRTDSAIHKGPPRSLLYSTKWIWQTTIPMRTASRMLVLVYRTWVAVRPTTTRRYENTERWNLSLQLGLCLFSRKMISKKGVSIWINALLCYDGTYLDTLNGAKDMSAEPVTKSPMMPFQCSSTGNINKQN